MAALSAVKNKKAAKMREGDFGTFLVQSYFKVLLYVLSCCFWSFGWQMPGYERGETDFLFS